MSALGERAVQAQDGIAELETALERTQRALKTAEKVDNAAGEVKRRSRKFVRMILVLTVVGIAVVVAKKVVAAGAPASSPDPYGATSTER